MHIVVLEQEPSSRRGGQELVLLDFCRGLAQRGYSISLIYTKEGNLLQQYQEFCRHIVNVNRFTVYRKPYAFSFLADVLKAASKIPITKNTIICSNQYQDSFFGCALALYKKIPFVCYLHIPPPDTPNHPFIEWQWERGLKGAKQFIAVSNQTKLDWVKCGYNNEKIEVVYNGIDTEVYQPTKQFELVRKKWNIPEETRVISYVGRLDKEKGLEILIKAFALLMKPDASTKHKLLIVGKPVLQGEGYKKSLQQLSDNLGLEQNVEFVGHVSDTTSVYQLSDVTVLPSCWSEPFGRAIVESMACGTPVVASRVGGIPEILTGEFQSGLFEPTNELDLSNVLRRIINWRSHNPQLGDRCRAHILSKFSLNAMVDGIEKVLMNIIKQPYNL